MNEIAQATEVRPGGSRFSATCRSRAHTEMRRLHMLRRYPLLSLVLGVLCCVIAHAAPPLADRIDVVFTRPEFADSAWGCTVRDAANGTLVYERNANTALIPASNQKLFVAAAALLELGPDHRFHTTVLKRGRVKDGVLHGDLVVRAGGAAYFTSRFPRDADFAQKRRRLGMQLTVFARRLRAMGISRIRGRIVADTTRWTDMRSNDNYPSAWGLSFNENTLDVAVRSGEVMTCPATLTGFSIERTSAVRFQDKAGGTDRIRVNAGRDSTDYWRIDATDPSTYYTDQVRAGLQAAGIRVDSDTLAVDGDTQELFRLPSPRLADFLKDMGNHSDNFRAELLFLNLGRALHGQASYDTGSRAVEDILRRAGLVGRRFVAKDGSGLSRDNRASAADTVNVLRGMYGCHLGDEFMSFLTVPGQPGTLANHLLQDDLQGAIHAKTGTLNGVKALSGYVQTSQGRWLAFSFLCNQAPGSHVVWQAFEDALRALVHG